MHNVHTQIFCFTLLLSVALVVEDKYLYIPSLMFINYFSSSNNAPLKVYEL